MNTTFSWKKLETYWRWDMDKDNALCKGRKRFPSSILGSLAVLIIKLTQGRLIGDKQFLFCVYKSHKSSKWLKQEAFIPFRLRNKYVDIARTKEFGFELVNLWGRFVYTALSINFLSLAIRTSSTLLV